MHELLDAFFGPFELVHFHSPSTLYTQCQYYAFNSVLKSRKWLFKLREFCACIIMVWLIHIFVRHIVCSVYLFVSRVQEQYQGAHALLFLQGATGVCSRGQPQD